jgi:glycosyltransferase involved in cell wall biosynthesis
VEQDLALELQLVGGGYHRPRLESLAEELGITEYVGFLGRIPFGPELFRIYREADIFVLPSLSEGIPKTLLEAMASGLPIVATRVGGIPDVIRDGETGLLVGPRSPEQIARAVERLIADSLLRRKVIQNGYAFVKEHTVERQAEMMWQEIRNFFCLER